MNEPQRQNTYRVGGEGGGGGRREWGGGGGGEAKLSGILPGRPTDIGLDKACYPCSR